MDEIGESPRRERTLALYSDVGTPPDIIDFANRFQHVDGSWRWLIWNAHMDSGRWYAAARDITEQMRLQHEAAHDPLTGLPNRVLLIDRISRAIARLIRHPGQVVILFVDVDRFKVINDSFGHEIGDHVLTTVSDRLRDSLRGESILSRLNLRSPGPASKGDESSRPPVSKPPDPVGPC